MQYKIEEEIINDFGELTQMEEIICVYCGTAVDVHEDSYLCEECEEFHVFCEVCEEYMPDEDALMHRHLWWHEDDGIWLGAGNMRQSLEYVKEIKASLLAVAQDAGMVAPLRQAIQRGEMGYDAIRLVGYNDVFLSLPGDNIFHLSDRISRLRLEEEEEKYADGILWLISLGNERTPEANKLTLEWLASDI
jgi:hypothetical protein